MNTLRQLQNTAVPDKLPTKLRDKIAFLARRQGKQFDIEAFTIQRKLRNQLAHPTVDEAEPFITMALAEDAYTYCFKLILDIQPHSMGLMNVD